MFYDVFCEKCKIKGVSPSRAALEMGISKGTVSSWKITPDVKQSGEVLSKIAEYFGVTTDELLGIEKAPAEGEGLTSLDKTIIDLMHSLPLEEELRWYSGSMFCYNKGSNVYHTHNCSLLNKTKPFYLKFWSEVDNMQKCQYCIPG